MKAESNTTHGQTPILLRLSIPKEKNSSKTLPHWNMWDADDESHFHESAKGVSKSESGWTVNRIKKCTERKIHAMERCESGGLHRFLLVQSCLAAVSATVAPGSVPVDGPGSLPVGRTERCPNDLKSQQKYDSTMASTSKLRRPSVHDRTLVSHNQQLVASKSGRDSPSVGLDSRPPKKRRLKRLLSDGGCFAASVSSPLPGLCAI